MLLFYGLANRIILNRAQDLQSLLFVIEHGGFKDSIGFYFGEDVVSSDLLSQFVLALKKKKIVHNVTLFLRNQSIDRTGIEHIAQLIDSYWPFEGAFFLQLAECNLTNSQLTPLWKILRKRGRSPAIRIGLRDNNIGDLGLKRLASVLKLRGFSPGMNFDLGTNSIGDMGMIAFSEAIVKKGLAVGVHFDFSDNKIGNKGAKALLSAVKQRGIPVGVRINLSLNKINNSWRKKLTEESIRQCGRDIFFGG